MTGVTVLTPQEKIKIDREMKLGSLVLLFFGFYRGFKMKYINDIYTLSKVFYRDYGNFKEILTNEKRSYNCLVLETKEDYFICVPFRSEINHKYSYLFKNSNRSKQHNSGVDYTKIVLIKDINYLGSKGLVDNDEYVEMMQNIQKINKEVNDYINGYLEYVINENIKYRKKYKYTTLKYFHDILEI